MTQELKYLVEIEATDDADIDRINQVLEQILHDLYDTGDVVSVKAIDKGPIKDDSMQEILSIVEGLDNERIMRAIDSVKELEREEEDTDG